MTLWNGENGRKHMTSEFQFCYFQIIYSWNLSICFVFVIRKHCNWQALMTKIYELLCIEIVRWPDWNEMILKEQKATPRKVRSLEKSLSHYNIWKLSSLILHLFLKFYIFFLLLPQCLRFLSHNLALEYDGSDAKALYRRALAREQLDNVGAAFKDAKEALRFSPKDK